MALMADSGAMTVDELARSSGTTTRNVRAYQSRGLLPPPRVVGRVGYYDEGHVARLAYIGRLQERGYSLAAIADLLDGYDDGRSLSQVLGFEEVLGAPWSDETPERFTRADLEEMFPEAKNDPTLLKRSVELGLLSVSGDDPAASDPEAVVYEAHSPRLIRAGAELVASGVPLSAALDHQALLAADMARIARRMVKLFETNVWEPFVASGLPADQWPRVTAALARVRPTAAAAVLAVLARAMEVAVAESAAEQTARLFGPPTGPDS